MSEAVGGSEWESNPSVTREAGRSPVLKTGTITGPHALPEPRCYHAIFPYGLLLMPARDSAMD